ncbi:MAG: glycine zipper 2TM domain-containing protein [Rickettsiaceae bacterium]|nr:glycine zipper 2TM domain-containing protein [Rickettsiaceae bacterium]
MKNLNLFKQLVVVVALVSFLSSCGRDLADDVYTSDSTQNLAMPGVVLSRRAVTIKESDKLGDNTLGAVAGGLTGAVAGNAFGKGTGNTLATIGGAGAGAAAGAFIQDKLSTSKGFEYIVKIDKETIESYTSSNNQAALNLIATRVSNGLITVVQGGNKAYGVGQPVYVIVSDKRTRIIPQ